MEDRELIVEDWKLILGAFTMSSLDKFIRDSDAISCPHLTMYVF